MTNTTSTGSEYNNIPNVSKDASVQNPSPSVPTNKPVVAAIAEDHGATPVPKKEPAAGGAVKATPGTPASMPKSLEAGATSVEDKGVSEIDKPPMKEEGQSANDLESAQIKQTEETKLNQRTAELDQRQADLDKIETELSQGETNLAVAQKDLENKKNEFETKNSQWETDKKQLTDNYHRHSDWLTDREKKVDGREKAVAKSETAVTGRETVVAGQETEIAERETAVMEREKIAASRQTRLRIVAVILLLLTLGVWGGVAGYGVYSYLPAKSKELEEKATAAATAVVKNDRNKADAEMNAAEGKMKEVDEKMKEAENKEDNVKTREAIIEQRKKEIKDAETRVLKKIDEWEEMQRKAAEAKDAAKTGDKGDSSSTDGTAAGANRENTGN